MTATADAVLTSSGSLAAPKLGDILTYKVTVTGPVLTVGPGTANLDGVEVKLNGIAWTGNVQPKAATFSPPVVTGVLSKPFAQSSTDPHIWTATV